MKNPVIRPPWSRCLDWRRRRRAEDLQTYTLMLQGHKFTPAELRVPSAKPFYLVVVNKDDTPTNSR